MSNSPGGPMGPEQFGSYMERRLTIRDDVLQVEARDGLLLRIRVREQLRTVDLTRFYDAYRKVPAQLDIVANTLVRVLLEEQPARSERSYAQVAERVYPMLKPIELLVHVRERNVPMVAYREFLGELIVTYVVDEGRSVSYLNEEHLERWQVAVVDLHAQALDNLRDRTRGIAAVSSGSDERRMFIFNSGDGYDASRLLLTDVITDWARQIPGQLVIGVPNRDFLIGFSDADPDLLRAFAAQVQTDAISGEHGLTDQLFTLEDGEIKEYDWE